MYLLAHNYDNFIFTHSDCEDRLAYYNLINLSELVVVPDRHLIVEVKSILFTTHQCNNLVFEQ